MADTPKLKRVTRLDSMPLGEWTPEGFLVDKPIVTSCGIFDYTNDDGTVRRELRLPDHVFAPESLASYKGKPVVITHPQGLVTSEHAIEEVVGTILSEGIKDGEHVRAEIVIHDTKEMKREGLKELSLGYKLVLDETPGIWRGQHYDAIQTEIRINHLALVDKARAGEEARLNIDAAEAVNKATGGRRTMAGKKQAMNADELKKSVAAYEKRRKMRLDGEDAPSTIPEKIIIEGVVKPVEGAEDNADMPGETKEMTLEEKVQEVKDRRDRRDADGDPEDPDTAKGIIAQQDEDISTLLELVEKLEAAQDMGAATPVADNKDADDDEDDKKTAADCDKPMNTDSVDKLIAERMKLARIGDKLNLDGIEQLKPLDAKKKIIAAIKPDVRLDGKSAVYVNAAFDIALNEYSSRKSTDAQRQQMFNGKFNADSAGGAQSGGAAAARERMADKILGGAE